MIPTREQEIAVLRAVVYASLFDYPLTIDQLEVSLGVRANAETIAEWHRSSELLQATIECRDGWFFPSGRRDLIETRSRREALSREFLARDRHLLTLVSTLPFVRMVALSGSLAHLNAEGSADLDLFVITAPNRVWSVTLTLLVIARLLGWRKRLCLNYVVSERALEVAPRDLFSANQIIHLRPISGRDVFDRFVTANAFVRDFYPNFQLNDELRPRPASGVLAHHGLGGGGKPVVETILSLGIAQLCERISRSVYGWHLRRTAAQWRSRDQVRLEPECLKLHTSSHRAATLEKFAAAMTAVLEREPAFAAVGDTYPRNRTY
jgi:hypothetical protein